MESSRQRHAVRGVVVAVLATFVALLSHVLGGGETPGWLGILVPLVLSLPVCVGLARWRLSLPRLVLSIGLSQFLFHALFVIGAPSGAAAFSSPAGHGSHAVVFVAGEAATAAASGSLAMWLWHGVAAVVTIAAVQRGESALTRIRRTGARVLSWVAARIVPAAPRPDATERPRLPAPAFSSASRSVGPSFSPLLRRGPPFALAL